MTARKKTFKDEYTCKVSGDTYQYEVEYVMTPEVSWQARIYKDGDLKGTPGGVVTHNAMHGEALKQYIVAYIEGILEKGLGIAE